VRVVVEGRTQGGFTVSLTVQGRTYRGMLALSVAEAVAAGLHPLQPPPGPLASPHHRRPFSTHGHCLDLSATSTSTGTTPLKRKSSCLQPGASPGPGSQASPTARSGPGAAPSQPSPLSKAQASGPRTPGTPGRPSKQARLGGELAKPKAARTAYNMFASEAWVSAGARPLPQGRCAAHAPAAPELPPPGARHGGLNRLPCSPPQSHAKALAPQGDTRELSRLVGEMWKVGARGVEAGAALRCTAGRSLLPRWHPQQQQCPAARPASDQPRGPRPPTAPLQAATDEERAPYYEEARLAKGEWERAVAEWQAARQRQQQEQEREQEREREREEQREREREQRRRQELQRRLAQPPVAKQLRSQLQVPGVGVGTGSVGGGGSLAPAAPALAPGGLLQQVLAASCCEPAEAAGAYAEPLLLDSAPAFISQVSETAGIYHTGGLGLGVAPDSWGYELQPGQHAAAAEAEALAGGCEAREAELPLPHAADLAWAPELLEQLAQDGAQL
jgi:hypothetical protein